ncbi:MAG: hypothetical protein ACTSW7_03755 [Candidatus Thorarchaeota archaeon]
MKIDPKLIEECVIVFEGTDANLAGICDLVSSMVTKSKTNIFLSHEIQLRISVLRNSIREVVNKIKKTK